VYLRNFSVISQVLLFKPYPCFELFCLQDYLYLSLDCNNLELLYSAHFMLDSIMLVYDEIIPVFFFVFSKVVVF
jgi:hypothetical protein